jgi:alkanesulfonate monooxygenase SsuD/methylene tetrahydromethanopterin reductase-like flavin-dependent oxidoreductase (luciferase family)
MNPHQSHTFPRRPGDRLERQDRDDPRRVGVAFTPFEARADLILRLGGQAEELGLDRVDLAEGWTHDSMILLNQLAARTRSIGLGTSVLSAWGRTPAVMALGAAGLQSCSEGRFSLGIGASSPPLTEGFHGVTWDRPVAHLRRTLTAVRALLAGDRLPDPAGDARPLRLGVVPETPIPIVLAALSPASIRLAGELADAWIPFLWARSRINDGRALLAEGESRSESASPTRVTVGVPVALGADEPGAREVAAWWISTYATRMGPLYPQLLSQRFGMAAAVNAVTDAARNGRAAELPPAAEDLAHEVTLFGTYDQAEAKIAAWFRAGADSVNLVLPPGRPEHELIEIMKVAARAVSTRRASVGQPSSAARESREALAPLKPLAAATLTSAQVSNGATG